MESQARSRAVLFGVAIAVVAGAAAVALWLRPTMPGVVTEAPAPAEAPLARSPAPPTPPASAALPAIQYPVEAAASGPVEPLASAEVTRSVTDLLGRPAVLKYLQLDDLPRRIVATVDNLGRSHAAAALWPVNPTPDRFQVLADGGVRTIAADNARRYAPFVALAEGVDTDRAVELYVRMYPLLQQAYEELGYPNRYFNDRLVQVIDGLLATPVPDGPIEVQLTEVKGPVRPVRPWVRYEFADPALEALPAGQKVLLRMGPENARRLKAKLAEFRRALTGDGAAAR